MVDAASMANVHFRSGNEHEHEDDKICILESYILSGETLLPCSDNDREAMYSYIFHARGTIISYMRDSECHENKRAR